METNAKLLKTAATLSKRNVPRRPTWPALACVHLEASDGTLTVTSTDLECVTRIALPAVGDLAPCLVPVDTLAKSGASSVDVIDATHVQLGALTIATLPVADFPTLPTDVDGDPQDAAGILRGFGVVAHAMSEDETRYHLNGVLLDGANAVATDGHRLAMVPHGATVGRDVIIPRHAVEWILGAKATGGTVVLGRNHARFSLARKDGLQVDVLTQYVDGTFPEYRRVIPRADSLTHRVELESAAVVQALDAVQPIVTAMRSAKNGPFVKVTLNGTLAIEATSPDLGTGIAHAAYLARNTEADVEWGVNPYYLRDACAIGERVTLGVKDGLSQMIFTAGDVSEIVMPCRL